MTSPSINVLQNFKVNTPEKFILYISTIIFLLSLFFPVQLLNASTIQKKSLIIAILGIIEWFVLILLELWYDSVNDYRAPSGVFCIFFIFLARIGYILATVLISTN
jgi:hypothetical protein